MKSPRVLTMKRWHLHDNILVVYLGICPCEEHPHNVQIFHLFLDWLNKSYCFGPRCSRWLWWTWDLFWTHILIKSQALHRLLSGYKITSSIPDRVQQVFKTRLCFANYEDLGKRNYLQQSGSLEAKIKIQTRIKEESNEGFLSHQGAILGLSAVYPDTLTAAGSREKG